MQQAAAVFNNTGKHQKTYQTAVMKKFFRNNILIVAGIIAGSVAGYLYWKYQGCSSGTCAITSKPLNSSLYGALMGGLLFSLFTKPGKEKKI